MAIGGQDLVCVRQEHSSSMAPADLRANLEDVGDALFSDGFYQSAIQRKARDANHMVPEVFNSVLQSNIIQLSSTVDTSRKDVWHYGSALQPCRCPLCKSVVTLLILAESSQLPQNNPEACRVMREIETYNRVFGERSSGLIQRLRDLPFLLRRLLNDLLDPRRSLSFVIKARVYLAMFLSAIYLFSPVDIIPEGKAVPYSQKSLPHAC